LKTNRFSNFQANLAGLTRSLLRDDRLIDSELDRLIDSELDRLIDSELDRLIDSELDRLID